MKSYIDGLIIGIVIILFFPVGLWIGSEIGDMLLSETTLVRPEDWVECEVIIPVIIGVIFGFLGFVAYLSFMAFIEWLSKKFKNVNKR